VIVPSAATAANGVSPRPLDGAVGKNVQHLEIAQEQIVRDDLAMALPPIRLGAHDRAGSLRRRQTQRLQRG
jgi:hypothetical protein